MISISLAIWSSMPNSKILALLITFIAKTSLVGVCSTRKTSAKAPWVTGSLSTFAQLFESVEVLEVGSLVAGAEVLGAPFQDAVVEFLVLGVLAPVEEIEHSLQRSLLMD